MGKAHSDRPIPDSWTAAWEEAEATLPPAVTLYNTIELQHPTFVDGIRCLELKNHG